MSANYSKEKLTLVNELIYQIKVKEAMSKKVIFFKENTTFREIQLKLKEKKISGVPILDNVKNIIGIVSIDDVITAFDKGYVDNKITDYMSREVITIAQNISVVSAIHRLEKFKVGRLPVTESSDSKRIVGVITLSDILNRLLVVVQSIAERVEDKEIKNTQISHDLIKSIAKKPLRFEVKGDDFDNAGRVASITKKYFQNLGIDKNIIRRIAIVCYEAEMNICLHSLGGSMTIKVSDNNAVIYAHDKGPGIPDVELALKPGFTTASEKIRALGFGAGMGLPNIKHYADKLEIKSSLKTGTELKAIINLGVKNEIK
ncbi:MAG: CBS domain-containing protein [Candidatus Atribacteria bacterium]|nr:CBS domain-containing protein [Candidatus Atribacteria bacterium]MBE3127307.1 CBS domain-containing protein [Candidatus Atribacteria bacterium]